MSLANDAYGRTVVSNGTANGQDIYTIGGAYVYNFPTGTPIENVYVYIAIQYNLELFNILLTDFINQRYSLESRTRWIALYMECQAFSRPVRQAYVGQLLAWGDSISQYTSAYIASVMAMTDPAVIAATTPDFSAFDASDPKINLIACMQIVG